MPVTVGEELFIGKQVAYWRERRGKSQRVLAGLAGMSQPHLSRIEAGVRPVERRGTLVALANALEVSVSDLVGQPGDPLDAAKAAAAANVPAVREALIRREVGELEPVVGDIDALMRAGVGYDFAAAAPMLPGLLGGLAGPDLIKAGHVAIFTLKHLGYADLARDAARLAVIEAREMDEPAWIGIAEFCRILSMPAELPGAPVRLAQRVLAEIEPHIGDVQVRQAYGMLHLHAALRAAVDGRADTAMDHLREAEDAAESLGEPENLETGLGWMGFGPTNVGIWRLSILLELGESGRAIEAARAVKPGLLPLANRQTPYYVDLGFALASEHRDNEAVAAFLRAEAIGPQFVRLRPTMRDTVGVIVRRTRKNAISKPLRHAAAAVNLPIQD